MAGNLLPNKSALLGVSGLGSGIRELPTRDDVTAIRAIAKHAIDSFVYRILCELGSLAAAFGRLGALICNAFFDENAVGIRTQVLIVARWLGIELDNKTNATGRACYSQNDVSARIVPAGNELLIARHTLFVARSHAG